jgi:hypothetical protein
MHHDLALELKEAGFPQRHFGRFLDCADPTLSQLIEECGEHFAHLATQKKGEWDCNWGAALGRTPEEAVARLWLALHKTV